VARTTAWPPPSRPPSTKPTGGNPLLVRRLAVGLRERGVPFSADRAGEIGRAGPEIIADTVGAAMARLGSEAAALARAVAILDDEAPLAVAGPLAGLRPAPPPRRPTSSCAPGSRGRGVRCASSTRSSATRCWHR
jgi:hypothetical protein